eukprot:11157520-Lingulodinium_polyedra.AAC.1
MANFAKTHVVQKPPLGQWLFSPLKDNTALEHETNLVGVGLEYALANNMAARLQWKLETDRGLVLHSTGLSCLTPP